jgi:hypothetical protein
MRLAEDRHFSSTIRAAIFREPEIAVDATIL